MSPDPSAKRFPRRLVFSLLLVLVSTEAATAQTEPTAPAKQRGLTPRLAETRGLPSPLPPPKEDAPVLPAAPKTDPQPAPPGFLGDTSKFTKLGGWGSFGTAMGEFGFAKSTLIMMPPVQEELKLTDDQKAKLRDLQGTMRKKGEEMGKSMRPKNGEDPMKASENLPIAARVVQFTSMISQFSTLARDNEAAINTILKGPQRKRLSQVALQMEGISALTKPEVVEALGMTEEEEQAVSQVLSQSRTLKMTSWIGSMMTMRPPNRRPGSGADPTAAPKAETTTTAPKADPAAKPDAIADTPENDAKARLEREKAMRKQFETMRTKTDQIQDRTVREVLKLLTKAQKTKFENLLGPPFDPKKINNLGRPPGAGPGPAPAPGAGPTKPPAPGA